MAVTSAMSLSLYVLYPEKSSTASKTGTSQTGSNKGDLDNLFVPVTLAKKILNQQQSVSFNTAIINIVFYLHKVQSTIIINMNWTNKDGITNAIASGYQTVAYQTVIQNKKSKSNFKEDYESEIESEAEDNESEIESDAQHQRQVTDTDSFNMYGLSDQHQRGNNEMEPLIKVLSRIKSELKRNIKLADG